jgi:adenosylcobinamide kinase/adenosylcobinamide-phosphate guanylyltransferase
MLTLVTGGARSGKSRFAQQLGCRAQRPAYLATARAEDPEMAARIARHRAERPAHWITAEEPLEISDAAAALAQTRDFILLDCLTLWLSNFCWEHRAEGEPEVQAAALREAARLAGVAPRSDLVVVTNELGCGLVPESPVGRAFRDLQGWVNQDLARAADRVYLLVAGIPVTVKEMGARQ